MEDDPYADIRAALQLPVGATPEWQITQIRLAVSLMSQQQQRYERRLSALEKKVHELGRKAQLSTLLIPPKEEKPKTEKEDNFVWKNKAVVYSILGILALVGEGFVQLIFSYIESKLHLK